ncbi:hypothetical protein KCU78_g951, partial [Aureobasidium melanogenum]
MLQKSYSRDISVSEELPTVTNDSHPKSPAVTADGPESFQPPVEAQVQPQDQHEDTAMTDAEDEQTDSDITMSDVDTIKSITVSSTPLSETIVDTPIDYAEVVFTKMGRGMTELRKGGVTKAKLRELSGDFHKSAETMSKKNNKRAAAKDVFAMDSPGPSCKRKST